MNNIKHIIGWRENLYLFYLTDSFTLKILDSILYVQTLILTISELPPHRKQAYADSKRDSKMTKINFPVAHITELKSFKFHQSQKFVIRYY
jgi:hypothetical protein